MPDPPTPGLTDGAEYPRCRIEGAPDEPIGAAGGADAAAVIGRLFCAARSSVGLPRARRALLTRPGVVAGLQPSDRDRIVTDAVSFASPKGEHRVHVASGFVSKRNPLLAALHC